MSHLLTASVVIKDIAALRRAAESFGAQFAEKKTFTSYSGERNKCDFCIALPHVRYEIGVIKNGDAYELSHDPYGREGSRHDGHKLVAAFGEGLGKLSQAYSRQVVLQKAKSSGFCVQEKKLANGQIRLQLISV